MSIIYSCGYSSKKENQESNKAVNQLNVIKNTSGTINNTISLMEMTPISYEALEQWFPKNLLNMQLSNIEKGSLSGNNITSSVAHYKGPNNASFDIIINDAAGKNGSIVVGSFSIYKNMTVDREDDYKIEKSFKKNKMAGIETYHKKRKESMMTFMYDDRFAIVISSKQLDRDTVWNAVENLDFSRLLSE